MAEPTPQTVRIKVTRDLGLSDVVLLGLGTMVGAGMFVLVGSAARVAGGAAILGIGMAAFVVFLNALTYAELSGSRPDVAGGGYGWVRESLPPPSGFLAGWLSWAGHLSAAALCAAGIGLFVDYLLDSAGVAFLPRDLVFAGTPFNASEKVLAILAFLGFVGIGLTPFSPRPRLSRLRGLKLALIVGFVAVAAIALLRVPDLGTKFGVPIQPGIVPGVTLAAGIFFVSFQGFEAIAQSADQVKSPHRNLPVGILAALGLATLLYLAVYLVALGNVAAVPGLCETAWECLAEGPRGLSEPELGSVFAAVSIPGFSGLPVALLFSAGFFAMGSALHGNMRAASRVSFAMARDGTLPTPFGRIDEATRMPHTTQLIGALIGLVLLLLLSIEEVAATAGILFLLLYAFVNVGLIVLRRRGRAAVRGFRVPLVPVVPILTAIISVGLAIDLFGFPILPPSFAAPGRVAWYAVGAWVGVGLIVHYAVGHRAPVRDLGGKPRVELLDVLGGQEDRFDPERYRVFLPLREFDDANLVEFGAIVAKARGGELSLLNVVEIPGSLPPKAIKFGYVDERISGLQKLARIGERRGVDTRAVVKLATKVYEIILETIREEQVNLLVMGWRGERLEGDRRVLGSNIDYLIENAPCDIVVFKTKAMKHPLDRIVVLSSPFWSVKGVDDLALTLARVDNAKITILSVADDASKVDAIKADAREFLEKAHQAGIEIDQKVVYSRAYETAALRESADADLLIVRTSPPSPLRRYALGPVEDRIAKLANVPVLIFRKGITA